MLASCVATCHSRLAAAPGAAVTRQPAPRRLPHRAVRAYKSEEQASGGEEAAAAAAAEYYGGAEVPKALSSYDDGGGYEAAVMPQVDLGALSSDEEMPEENYAFAACPLRPAAPTAEDIEAASREMADKQDMAASMDGMVGNYEFAIEEKQAELLEVTDDLQRILAELAQLEAAASGKGATGKGAEVK